MARLPACTQENVTKAAFFCVAINNRDETKDYSFTTFLKKFFLIFVVAIFIFPTFIHCSHNL